MTGHAVAPDATSYAPEARPSLTLVSVRCCICEHDDAEPVAVGEDFEYRSSADSFLAVRCRSCGLIYLNPRPTLDELPRIYPPTYHAYNFSKNRFGIVYRARSEIEARRLLRWCHSLPDDARILDVGCGDGFHLSLLRAFGKPGWRLEGVEPSASAAQAARESGLTVHQGIVQQLDLPRDSYDLVLLIQTVEHVDDPVGVLRAVRSLLRPGGRVVIVTDNTDTIDFKIFQGRHWGGYHFPRHWNLFNRATLHGLARKVEMEVETLEWLLSPVNWVYSLHNLLVDWGAPRWLVNRFGLAAPGSLALFTIVDACCGLLGKGALMRASFRRPV